MNQNSRRLTKPRRHPGQWTSYNKVLIGCGKRPHARNPNFDWDETKLLISLWGDPGVQRTLITTHKKYPVIAKIAMSMREHGYNRTPEEINTRIKNLKCFYNRVKKDLEMGVINAPSWPHYEAMDEILSRPIFGNNARMSNNGSAAHTSSQSSQSPKDSVAHLVEPEIKEENISDEDSSKLEIIDKDFLIKDEPIDDDDDGQAELLDSEIDEDFDEDLEDEQPPLPKLQKISTPKLNNLPQLDKIVSRPVELKLLDTPCSGGSAAVNISNTPTTNGTSGKISLVPTNILLKPQAQVQYASTPNIQTISTTPTQPKTVTTSQGMKLVFVNTLTNTSGGNSSQAPTNSSSHQQPQPQPVLNTLPKLQPKVMPALQPAIQIDTPKLNAAKIASAKASSMTDASNAKDQNFRGLLKQLVRLQNENLTMQRQRLNIERQRLEVEKNLGHRIIGLLTTLQENFTGASNHASSQPQPTRTSYRLRREKRTNHHSSDYEDQD